MTVVTGDLLLTPSIDAPSFPVGLPITLMPCRCRRPTISGCLSSYAGESLRRGQGFFGIAARDTRDVGMTIRAVYVVGQVSVWMVAEQLDTLGGQWRRLHWRDCADVVEHP